MRRMAKRGEIEGPEAGRRQHKALGHGIGVGGQMQQTGLKPGIPDLPV